MTASSFRNVPDELGEPAPDFAHVHGKAVLAAPLPQPFQRCLCPAVMFPTPIVTGQAPQHTLWAADGLVVLAGRQFVAPFARVEAQLPPLRVEPGRLLFVLGVEPTNH